MRFAVLFLLLALLAGCGSSGAPSDSGIRGQALARICAAEQQGMDCTAPVETRFEVRQSGHVVETVDTDADGRFSVTLEPGSYVLQREDGLPSLQPITIVVRAGEYTSVQLAFDSGIR